MSHIKPSLLLFLVAFCLLLQEPILAAESRFTHYEPTHESIKNHPFPEWYEDAKFGIMIHYGLYSVPGWAPIFNPSDKIFSKEYFINNPYAEWYINTMKIVGSPTYEYHKKTYGENFHYDDFVPLFNAELKKWNPDKWASLFSAANAKYVVFVSKHHDGFLLWPSDQPNPHKPNYFTKRDVVGELTQAVRKQHMRMGIYYNGDDWAWQDPSNLPVTDLATLSKNMPQTKEYADYVDHHWRELIDKYHPDLIWNDFALTKKVDKWKLFAYYYNSIPWGVLDNRWGQDKPNFSIMGQPADELIDLQFTYDWFDYYTPEYLPHYRLTRHRWEADHGPGYSFGYNRNEYEHPEHLKTLDEMIVDLVDIVSKNGNLLLAISPEADGTIPPYQEKILLGMGEWLKINGEAIFGTRPWSFAEGQTSDSNIQVRFTRSKMNENLYVTFIQNPYGKNVISIKDLLIPNPNTRIVLLDGEKGIPVKWTRTNKDLTLVLPSDLPKEHPVVFKITPCPLLKTG